MIAGTPNGFYGIWGTSFEFQPGRRFVVELTKIYVYILEVPATKCSKYAQYALTVSTPCPYVIELKYNSEGNVPGLGLPWATVYKVIKSNRGYVQSTPCNLVDADSTLVDPTTSCPGDEKIELYMNGVTSFQYMYISGYGECRGDGDAISVGCQGVEKVYSNTYVERTFYEYNKVNASCKVSTYAEGQFLANQGYDFQNWLEPAGFCRFATITSVVDTSYGSPSPGYSILSFVSSPCTKVYRLISLITANVKDDATRTLRQVCARLSDCS